MLSRRLLLGSATTGLLAAPTLLHAQAPRASGMPAELVFAVVPAENAAGVTERYSAFIDYLSRSLGTKVTLRVASDYAAVIEGQRSGTIHVAFYGPSAFARALMTNAPVEAFLIEVNEDGAKGYYSVFWVKTDSPYRTVQDLRGKNLGLVDPNSTSGNNVPRFALNKMGINPEQFFGRVVYAGSHENAIIALNQGTVDVAANWWNDERESNLLRMERKGMVKAADFRIVFRSEQIVNSPMAWLSALPAATKAAIRQAFLDLPQREPAIFQRMTDGKQKPWEPVTNAAYQPIIELNRFVDNLRRQRT
jgi:phosphonate transport system substrate-binding protein